MNNKIYQKLFNVQKKIKELVKDEENKFQRYLYFNEYQVLTKLKPLLTEENLVLTFSDVENEFVYEKMEKEYLVRYLKKAILTNSENAEEQLVYYFWAIGSNTDPAKAKGAAETYAIKYFLSKFFLMPVTDETDPDVWK